MIRHIVMWDVQGDSQSEKTATAHVIKARFEALAPLIPGLRKLEIGLDHSGVDYACDMVLYSEFEDQAALDAYAIHPDHLRLRDALLGLRIARHQVDYAID
jgi:hypothetical protein